MLLKPMWCTQITFTVKFVSIHLDAFECQPSLLVIKIFLITKLGDQKISIATMDYDQKNLVAKSHDCNFFVITDFF
jgi:hypothetical protein